MDRLVGKLILSGGEKVMLTFSDGRKITAVYQTTFGNTHVFALSGGGEIKLSNRFMQKDDIEIRLVK